MSENMKEKVYYSERKGMVNPIQIDFSTFKRFFLHTFNFFDDKFYFREATGYSCVDGYIHGHWGSDVESYIFMKLKMTDIWPIKDNIEMYDETTLFTIIEFLYDYVSEPQKIVNHTWDNCGLHTDDYDKEIGRKNYREEVNKILKNYDIGYQLSLDGEVLEITPEGFEELIEEIPQTDDSSNIDDRIKTSVSKYFKYGSTIDVKKDAIRVLADVLEYLKKEGHTLDSKDDSDLFNIMNNYDIRHHNKFQKNDYNVHIWYDWFFYNFLSSIYVILKSKESSSDI